MKAMLGARSLFGRILGAAGAEAEEIAAGPELRSSERQEAALSAEIVSCGRTYRGQIRNISSGGLTLAFPDLPSLFKGAQLLVIAGELGPISGSVRWIKGNECGMAFNRALAEDVLEDTTILFDPGKRSRPGRARIRLSAVAHGTSFRRKVLIENIGSGGALLSTSLPLPAGCGLMLEMGDFAPIGAHVRWSSPDRCGLMFSKLLPIRIAEELAACCSIHRSWLDEIQAAHADLANAA